MKRILLSITVSILLIMAITNVKAAGNVSWSGADFISIERTVDNTAVSITNTFTYTINADDSNPEGASNAPASAIVTFDGSESVSDDKVVKAVNLSFGTMSFTRPGTYTYKLTETATSDSNYPVDTGKEYTIVISVQNELNSADGTPTGNFIANLILEDKTGNKIDPSIASFISSSLDSNTSRLTITNTVTGNDADFNLYFPFSITLSDTVNPYSIHVPDPVIIYNDQTITQPTSTINGTATIYLKHGQAATIGANDTCPICGDIPVGTMYTIIEDPQSYSTAHKINSGVITSGYDVTDEHARPNNTQVDFINTKNIPIITGVLTNTIPYIILIALCVVGTVLYITIKNTEKN